jgi:hypothetical protein
LHDDSVLSPQTVVSIHNRCGNEIETLILALQKYSKYDAEMRGTFGTKNNIGKFDILCQKL